MIKIRKYGALLAYRVHGTKNIHPVATFRNTFSLLIFCWPCISIYLFININQFNALNFIISLLQVSTCFEHYVLIVRRAKLYYTIGIINWYHHTYRCGDTRDCITKFCPPDNEHICSKHVEAWSKLIIKFSASSWLILIKKKKLFHLERPETV